MPIIDIQECPNQQLQLTTQCPHCRQTHKLLVSQDSYTAWNAGKLIQNAFPDMGAIDRERLITGICPACWADIFTE